MLAISHRKCAVAIYIQLITATLPSSLGVHKHEGGTCGGIYGSLSELQGPSLVTVYMSNCAILLYSLVVIVFIVLGLV